MKITNCQGFRAVASMGAKNPPSKNPDYGPADLLYDFIQLFRGLRAQKLFLESAPLDECREIAVKYI